MRDLALHLARSGHDVVYLTMQHWDAETPPKLEGVRVLGLVHPGRVYEDERRTLGPPLRFGVLSFIGTFIYVVVLSSIGYSLGGEWAKVNHGLTQATYILVAVVAVAIVVFVFYRLREFRREAAAAGPRDGTPKHRVQR